MQHQMNIPNNSVMYSQPYSSQMRPLDQWLPPQQQNYMRQPSLGTAPHLLSAIPADHMIPSSSIVTTIAIPTSTFSALQSSSYTYSQTTTVDTIMTTVQCGISSLHRLFYGVCDYPTSMASFQVGL